MILKLGFMQGRLINSEKKKYYTVFSFKKLVKRI